MNYILILSLICFIGAVHSFVPASVMSQVLYKLDGRFKGNLGRVSDSLTHDEIVKRGLIQSVANYMKDQPNSKINMSKIDTGEYYDVRKLYFDFYGKKIFPSSDISTTKRVRVWLRVFNFLRIWISVLVWVVSKSIANIENIFFNTTKNS